MSIPKNNLKKLKIDIFFLHKLTFHLAMWHNKNFGFYVYINEKRKFRIPQNKFKMKRNSFFF
jgi:hypothetical protein